MGGGGMVSLGEGLGAPLVWRGVPAWGGALVGGWGGDGAGGEEGGGEKYCLRGMLAAR